ncbi:hypothetical protein [Paenibacillus sp. LPE1-1-1.1]|uniref:hypothetical protein n=1 Tax=Paenibacillus sp. LPE1-1-1.1 TaxID=3135230 RepID=UPI003449D46D
MKKLLAVLLTAFTYLAAFIYFFPLLWMFITGFKNEGEAVIMPPSIFLTRRWTIIKTFGARESVHF